MMRGKSRMKKEKRIYLTLRGLTTRGTLRVVPIGETRTDPGRVQLGERKKKERKGASCTIGHGSYPIGKRHGNDFISARAGDRVWWKKIETERTTEAE